MSIQPLLILAVTRMQAGLCTAGMSTTPDPVSGLCWVRPTRSFGHLLLGDLTTPDDRVIRPFDVVEFDLLRANHSPPHREDWLAELVHHRVRVVRTLEGDRRARFLAQHMDKAPGEVLDAQQRSLCLFRPDWVRGSIRQDALSGQIEARLQFGLNGKHYLGSIAKGGLPVTDVKWRALARSWLPPATYGLDFRGDEVKERLGVDELYLAVGLSRSFDKGFWPLIIGVHTVPDYAAAVDYANL